MKDTEPVTLELTDGIIYCKYNVENVTFEVADSMIKKKLEILKGKEYPALINAKCVGSFNEDAKKLFTGEDSNKGLTKCAVLTNSKIQLVVVNLFTYLNRSRIPMKMFYKEDKAILWLKSEL